LSDPIAMVDGSGVVMSGWNLNSGGASGAVVGTLAAKSGFVKTDTVGRYSMVTGVDSTGFFPSIGGGGVKELMCTCTTAWPLLTASRSSSNEVQCWRDSVCLQATWEEEIEEWWERSVR